MQAYYEFEVPEECIVRYLAVSYGMKAAGAITIEGYGAQFLKKVEGSYSAIIGLPLFELREALQKLDFRY